MKIEIEAGGQLALQMMIAISFTGLSIFHSSSRINFNEELPASHSINVCGKRRNNSVEVYALY